MKLYFFTELAVYISIIAIPAIVLVVLTYKSPASKFARTGAWLLNFAMWGLLLFLPREYIGISTTDTAGNTYIAAEVRSPLRGRGNLYSIKLMKFSSSGRLLWSRRHNLFEGEYALVSAIQAGAGDELYLCVEPESGQRGFIAKADAHGRIAWKAESALSAEDLSIRNNRIHLLGVDGTGQLAVEVYEPGKGARIQVLSFSRGLESPPRAKWVCSGGDGDIYVYSKNNGASLAKLGPAGNELWEIPVDSEISCSVLATDGLGNIYIGGARRPSAYVHKLTPDGKTVWEREFRLEAGEESAFVSDIRAGKDGAVYTAGSATTFTGRTHGVIRYRNSFVAKFRSDGTLEWRHHLKSERNHDNSLGVGHENGSLLLAGDGPWWSQWISLSKYSPDGRRIWKAVALPLDITIVAIALSALIGCRLLQSNGRGREKAVP